jgi:hypothetical protein
LARLVSPPLIVPVHPYVGSTKIFNDDPTHMHRIEEIIHTIKVLQFSHIKNGIAAVNLKCALEVVRLE